MYSNRPKFHLSPLSNVIKVALIILGGEFMIMLVESTVDTTLVSTASWDFLDPLLLIIMVSPALHMLVLKPMKLQQQLLELQKDSLAVAAISFNSSEGIMVTDENHVIVKVNAAFTRVTGYSSDEVLGKTPKILQSGKHDRAFYDAMRTSLQRDKNWEGEIWNRRKNGQIYPELLHITAVTSETGHVYFVGIFSDITTRKNNEEKIFFIAYHDQLTGLSNRALFYDRLEQAISQSKRNGSGVALLFLDLDGFKCINDEHGHAIGDAVLKLTAERLLECTREVDTVTRLGGDEFAIVLCGLQNSENATHIAAKIIQKLNEPINLANGVTCKIGVSIGIATYPQHGTEIDSLLSAADRAMYQSKTAGKNTCTFAQSIHADSPDKEA